MTKRVSICTLGCKVNTYESEAVKKQFESHGFIVLTLASARMFT